MTEIAGGDFSLTLVHPITEDLRWRELQEERIIKAPDQAYKPLEDDGTVIVPAEQATEQCFRIYSVSVDTHLASHNPNRYLVICIVQFQFDCLAFQEAGERLFCFAS